MANRIKEWREKRGLTQEELGKMIGTTGQQIGRLEKAGQENGRRLTTDWLSRLAPALKVREDDLMALDYQPKRMKIAGNVQAGYWAEPQEEAEELALGEFIDVPLEDAYHALPLYALRVVGSSMDKVYPEGTLLICCHMEALQEPYTSEKRYIVKRTKRDGRIETTVKKLVIDQAGRHWLWPESNSPEHQLPLVGDRGEEGEEIEIQARVLWSMRAE